MASNDTHKSLSGRLELTWTNKDLRLLAHEDGSYEWLPPSDWRVSEVRLLENLATYGQTKPDKRRAQDNLLIEGDALNALTSLLSLPEFAREYAGNIKLCYIDPPFNTQQSFLQYDDALEHSVWLTMMRDRLVQIRDLLAEDGSVWVHLDDSEAAYCRVLMDEIFGRERYVATIAWESAQGGRGDTDIAPTHDNIIVYAMNRKLWRQKRNPVHRNAKQLARFKNPDNDPKGPWRQGDDGTAKSGSASTNFPITLPSGRIVKPPEGRYWAFSKSTYERLLQENRIYFGRNGDSLPIPKRYLSEVKDGVTPKTWWPASEVGSNQDAKRDHLRKLFPDAKPFDTPKPEWLIQRIIEIATDPGELVLDCFLGSGTTAAVAHKMNRKWVGIERSSDVVAEYCVPRMTLVVDGEEPLGISDAVGWTGGGGFRTLRVAPSMFTVDGGIVFLDDWATNGKLAEVTAAQLGFSYEPDPPYSGRKGRSRLAVIDGLVNEAVVRALVHVLDSTWKIVICGTAIDPDCRKLLKELRPGSTLRKIPASILDEYQARAGVQL